MRASDAAADGQPHDRDSLRHSTAAPRRNAAEASAASKDVSNSALQPCRVDCDSWQSLGGVGVGSQSRSNGAAAHAVAAAAYFGTAWVVRASGQLTILRDDGIDKCRCAVDLGGGKGRGHGALAGAKIAVSPLDPAVAAIALQWDRPHGSSGTLSTSLDATASADATAASVVVVRLLERPLDGSPRHAAAAPVSASVLPVQLPPCLSEPMSLHVQQAAPCVPAVAWGSQGDTLLVGRHSGQLLTANAAAAESAGLKVALAKPLVALPASFGGVRDLAVVSGAAGGAAVLVATAEKLLVVPTQTQEGSIADALAACGRQPGRWGAAVALSCKDSMSAGTNVAGGACAPLLRVTAAAGATTAHVVWRGSSGPLYTFDLDTSTPSAFASCAALYVRQSLQALAVPVDTTVTNACALPWIAMAAVAADAASEPRAARLLSFSRASGRYLGATDVPESLSVAGAAPFLAVDSDSPYADVAAPIAAVAASAVALAPVGAPAALTAVVLELVEAGRHDAAHKLLASADAPMHAQARRVGWSALGRDLHRRGLWRDAARAFAQVPGPCRGAKRAERRER